MELVYALKDKSLSEDGWILDENYLEKIRKEMEELGVTYFAGVCVEDIEAILLVANGEGHLLRSAYTKINNRKG